jgi:membrane-bound lytic murein transglycosylase D
MRPTPFVSGPARALAGLLLPLLLAACAGLPAPQEPSADAPVIAAVQAANAASAAEATASAPASAASAPADAASAAAPDEAKEAAGAPTDPLRPDEPVNLADSTAHADLWARIRRGFKMPDLTGDLVRNREQWYATRPDYVQRMTERGSRYLFHIVEEVERRNMPTELALLPFIESAFNPQAMSVAKASGMWQFIPSTGRDYDLTQNIFRDERRDVLASTRAALDYLNRLYGMFGDWHLALAAYNWGEGSVSRAIARNRKAGKPTDYESLRMPAETRYYVPKLQAVKNLIAQPEAFGLVLPQVANHPYFLTVPIQRDIDVALAARLAEVEVDEFKTLNPSLNKPVILAAGTPQLLLPYDNASLFLRNLENHKGPLASWTAWVVPKTMRPAEAAKRVGMSEDDLRDVNRIPVRMLVRAGSTLLVPRNGHREQDVSERIADNAMMSLAPEGPQARRVTLRAGKSDTVASVARRYRVSAAQVAQWNNVSRNARFARGQSIVVYVPRAAAKATRSAARPAAKASAKSAKASRPAKATRSAARSSGSKSRVTAKR